GPNATRWEPVAPRNRKKIPRVLVPQQAARRNRHHVSDSDRTIANYHLFVTKACGWEHPARRAMFARFIFHGVIRVRHGAGTGVTLMEHAKSGFGKFWLAAGAAVGLSLCAAGPASAMITCNSYGDCWRTETRVTFPGVTFSYHDDAWRDAH